MRGYIPDGYLCIKMFSTTLLIERLEVTYMLRKRGKMVKYVGVSMPCNIIPLFMLQLIETFDLVWITYNIHLEDDQGNLNTD